MINLLKEDLVKVWKSGLNEISVGFMVRDLYDYKEYSNYEEQTLIIPGDSVIYNEDSSNKEEFLNYNENYYGMLDDEDLYDVIDVLNCYDSFDETLKHGEIILDMSYEDELMVTVDNIEYIFYDNEGVKVREALDNEFVICPYKEEIKVKFEDVKKVEFSNGYIYEVLSFKENSFTLKPIQRLVSYTDVKVTNRPRIPEYHNMWSFNSKDDELWVKEHLYEVSKCGFRIFEDKKNSKIYLSTDKTPTINDNWLPLYEKNKNWSTILDDLKLDDNKTLKQNLEKEAFNVWFNELNIVKTELVEDLAGTYNIEQTFIFKGDKVLYDDEEYEVINILKDDDNKGITDDYSFVLQNVNTSDKIITGFSRIELIKESRFPKYKYMWSFKSEKDGFWVEKNTEKVSEIGFRIFEVEERIYIGLDDEPSIEKHFKPLFNLRKSSWETVLKEI